MSENEKTAEYGFSIGESAYALSTMGATDAQVRSFVNFNGMYIQSSEKNAYITGARRGYTSKATRLSHPIYRMHLDNLRNYIKIGAACLSL